MEHQTTLYLTWGIIGVIAVMTIFALLSRRPGVAHNAPSILTSLGIFGTFLGITIGLSGFDSNDVASSVTYLFGGVKLAFWTSVAGIAGGILVKFRHLFLFPGEEGRRVTLDDLVQAVRGVDASLTDDQKSPLLASLREIQTEARDHSQSHDQALQASMAAIKKSVDAADPRDQALLDQLRRMDSSSAAGFEKLAAAFAGMSNDLSSELSDKLSSSTEKSAETTARQMQGVAEAIRSLHGAMGDDSAALLQKLDSVKSGSESVGERLSAVLGHNQTAVADAIGHLQGAMSGDSAQMLERMEAMRRGSETLGERLSEVLGASNQNLAEAMQGNRDALAAQIGTAVTELRDALVGPEGAAQTLSGTLQQGQVELASALAKFSENLQSAVDEDLATLNGNLAASGEQTARQMEQVAEAIGTLQTAMGGDTASLLDKLDTLRAGSDGLGERLSEVLGANNQALAEAMESNRDAMAAQVTTAVTEIRDALVGPEGAAKALSGTMQQGQVELARALAQVSENLQSTVDKDLATLNGNLAASGEQTARQMEQVAEAIGTLQTAMGGDTASLLDKLDTLRAGSDGLGERLSEVLGANNQALAEAMESNRDAMAAQVTTAVTEIRDALVGPEGAAKALSGTMQQGQVELARALAQVSENLQSTVDKDLATLNGNLAASGEETARQMQQVAESIGTLQTAMGGDTASLLDKLDTLRAGSDGLGERLSEVLAANNQALAEALQSNRDAMAAQVTTAVTEIRDALVGPEGAAQALSGTMQQGQLDLARALAQVSENLQSTVDKDLATLNGNLAASGEETARQMQQVAESIGTLQTAMGGDTASLLDKLDTLRAGSDGLGERLSEVLGANNLALAEAMQGNRDAMAAQLTTAVTDLRDALVGPDGAAATVTSELGRQLQQGQAELTKALAHNAESFRSALGEDSAAMLAGLNQLGSGLDALSEAMLGSIGEMGSSMSGDVNQLATTVADAVDDLRIAIVGPDAQSGGFVEDLRKAHDDAQKQLQAIHTALKENTQRQIDFSPKGLMTTLEELIKQFTTQFSGQFWAKIGGFNHAIGELIKWMETYRSQLDDMVDMQSRSTKNMDTATRRFDEIASKSEIFIDVSRNISALLGGVDSQRVQIESHLKRFAHIVDETSNALENIEERIVAGNSNMNKHLSDIAERIEEQVIRVDQAMDTELRKALTTFGSQLAALSEKFVEDYTPLTNRLRDVVGMARDVSHVE